jgi:TolA-binding protein
MWSRSALTALLLAAVCGAAQATPESDDFRALQKTALHASAAEASAAARAFIKEHPASSHVADARLIIAEREPNPDKALSRYESILKNYRYFSGRDEARLSLCRILLLTSRFSDCAEEAGNGAKSAESSAHKKEFTLFEARALYAAQRYNEVIRLLSGTDSDDAKILLADAQSKTDDPSLDWAALVREDYPETALYCLAKEYEADGMKHEAFSAYSDLIKKYPRSIEALYAAKPKARLAKAGAKYKSEPVQKKQKLVRLVPERAEISGTDDNEYAVLIGPFFNLKQAGAIKKEMTSEFARAVIVKKEREFVIYVGRADKENAVSMKIRLAEEFGFNGTIVNIREEDNSEYFYGQ